MLEFSQAAVPLAPNRALAVEESPPSSFGGAVELSPSRQRLAASRRVVSAWRLVTMCILAADLAAVPFLSLVPYGFQLDRWAHQQVQRWHLDHSAADWMLVAALRSALMLVAVVPSKASPAKLRWARRAAVFTAAFGVWRSTMIKVRDGTDEAHLLPVLVFSAVSSVLLAVVSHRLMQAAAAVDVMRHGASETAAFSEAGGDEAFWGQLLHPQALRVLRPYFWPSAGEPQMVRRNRCLALSMWVCVGLSKAFGILAPIFLGLATDNLVGEWKRPSGQEPTTPKDAVAAIVFYALLLLLSKAFAELQSLVYVKVQQAACTEIADRTFAHLHSLSLDWHSCRRAGEVQRQMDRGIQASQQTMQHVFLYILPTTGEAVAVLLVIACHFWSLRLATFVGLNLAAYIYATVKVSLWRKQFRPATTHNDNRLHERLNDILVNYETTKYFTAEEYERREYEKMVSEFQKVSMATHASLSFLNVIQQAILIFTLAGGIVLATSDILSSEKGVMGNFVCVNAYIIGVFASLNSFGTVYSIVVTAVVDTYKFGQLLAEPATVEDAACALALDCMRPSETAVEFQSVFFAYKNQPHARSLKSVSFKLPHGRSLALVGAPGAGKTTVTRLLLRLYDACSGAVLVYGQDVRTVTQQSLRAAIGIVPQDVVLFNSTISHNIRYGRIGSAAEEDAVRAAREAQLDEFVGQQEKGYDTAVGERGLKLAGDEKRRLAIARCLLKDPKIIVLDEARYACDSHTECLVQRALATLSASRSVVAIANRLSTIKGFDEIVCLESGQVVERGDHSELLGRPHSRYAEAWCQQAGGRAA